MKRLWSKKVVSFFMVLIALIVTTFVLPCLPVQAATSVAENWGVFVGISSYQYIKDTWYGADNAQALYNEISPVWGTSHIRLLTNSKAKKASILDAIAWLAQQADSNDTVLFDFNGHGSPGPYLCAYDSMPFSYENDISDNELANALESIKANKIVVILDNCYAGDFKYDLAGNGRVILMGTSPGELGWEYKPFGHFVYTYYLLQAFDLFSNTSSTSPTADIDINNDYVLSAEEISIFAEPKTSQYEIDNQSCGFTSIQHPTLDDGYSGDLALLVKFMFKTNIYVPYDANVLTLDGSEYKSPAGPLIWAPGSTHTLSVMDMITKGADTRYVFTGWGDGDTSTSREVYKGSYTANYNKEYLLSIASAYGDVTGPGWYVDGTTAAFSVTPLIELADTKHIFTGWSGDYTGTGASGTLVMSAPQTLTANWRNEYLLTVSSEYNTPTGAGW